MKLKVIVATLIFSLPFLAKAQMEQIKGRLVNKETKEAVSFANIVLPGTTHGTSSDSDGYFSIGYTDLMKELSFKISAVGFATVDLPIGKAVEDSQRGELVIEVAPIVYNVGEVDIYGKSMVYRRILREVVEKIPDNYYAQPYNYIGKFVEKTATPGGEHFRDAEVVIYNSKGYCRMDAKEFFTSEGYRFNQATRSFNPISAYDGLTLMDEILNADVVMAPRNVLDNSINDEYTFTDKGTTNVDGKMVQIFGFSVKKPTQANVYVPNAKSCSGEIYIDAENRAVVQYHVVYELDGTNYLGYNLIANNNTPAKLDILVNYKPYESKYILSGVAITVANKRLEYVTTAIQVDSPEVITGRQYMER